VLLLLFLGLFDNEGAVAMNKYSIDLEKLNLKRGYGFNKESENLTFGGLGGNQYTAEGEVDNPYPQYNDSLKMALQRARDISFTSVEDGQKSDEQKKFDKTKFLQGIVEASAKPTPDVVNTVESLEGPEAIGSAAVQMLANQTDTVARGDKGNKVLNAQLRLAELGYDIGRGGTRGLTKNTLGKWSSLDNSQLRGVDSDFGPATQKAVRAFQVDASLPVTGSIDPATALAMSAKSSVAFNVPENFTNGFSSTQNTNFNVSKDAAVKEGLEGVELASFMSQVAHESDGFRTASEYASGSAYEGRADLGNTQTGDGKKFKGRGYLQLTGRSNYKEAGKALGLDLINNPSLAEEPKNSAAVSLWFWKTKVRPQVPDFMDTERVTKVVNGGFIGLKDRKSYFDKFTKKWNEAP